MKQRAEEKKLNLNLSLRTLCGLELVWLLGGLVFSIGNHSIVSTLCYK